MDLNNINQVLPIENANINFYKTNNFNYNEKSPIYSTIVKNIYVSKNSNLVQNEFNEVVYDIQVIGDENDDNIINKVCLKGEDYIIFYEVNNALVSDKDGNNPLPINETQNNVEDEKILYNYIQYISTDVRNHIELRKKLNDFYLLNFSDAEDGEDDESDLLKNFIEIVYDEDTNSYNVDGLFIPTLEAENKKVFSGIKKIKNIKSLIKDNTINIIKGDENYTSTDLIKYHIQNNDEKIFIYFPNYLINNVTSTSFLSLLKNLPNSYIVIDNVNMMMETETIFLILENLLNSFNSYKYNTSFILLLNDSIDVSAFTKHYKYSLSKTNIISVNNNEISMEKVKKTTSNINSLDKYGKQ